MDTNDLSEYDPHEGRGAIWWPPIVIMLGLFGWMVVAQILKVMR